MGGALLAVRSAPTHERVWGSSAAAEEATARYLAQRCPDALVLHDRWLPGSWANIDHIAVVASGAYVIDSTRYKNGKIRVAMPLIGAGKLLIDGRDRTKLVDSLLGQVQVVSDVLAALGSGIPVHGALWFIGGNLPLLRHAHDPGSESAQPQALGEGAPPPRATRPRWYAGDRVPLLVLDDGSVVTGSGAIAAWARNQPSAA